MIYMNNDDQKIIEEGLERLSLDPKRKDKNETNDHLQKVCVCYQKCNDASHQPPQETPTTSESYQSDTNKDMKYSAHINPKDEEITHKLEWEEMSIPSMLVINLTEKDLPAALEKYRAWLLGGKYCEWRYTKNKVTGEITLYRR